MPFKRCILLHIYFTCLFQVSSLHFTRDSCSAGKIPLNSVNGLLFVFKLNGPLLKMERNFDAAGNIFAFVAAEICHQTDFMNRDFLSNFN